MGEQGAPMRRARRADQNGYIIQIFGAPNKKI